LLEVVVEVDLVVVVVEVLDTFLLTSHKEA
jgi:hypothetical protein